ncbi:MAG TPA: alpha/beta hydrolase [Anaerolineae bacterium]|nr:alpha/beta hydrolase [Anaerolineae bacterium]HOR01123.1 alpha/beta hydrolase [Anaerolineae bacterium]HPL29585.1 alpha/beta hydrolase [Anaerolineae bacterium]
MTLPAVTLIALLAFLAAAYRLGVRRLIAPRFARSRETPADHGLPYEDVHFATCDGLRLHGWFVPAEAPRGTIIFCHGHGGTPAHDLSYVPALRARGYNVLLFDFRAHGQSEGRFTSLGYFERRDLLAAIGYLEGRGIRRVGLLGFSMGAAVAMATAPDAPAVAAVVADCGFAELWHAAARGALEWGVPYPLAGAIGWLIVLLASLRLRAPLWTADPIRRVAKIAPRPLLIIQGGRDVFVPTHAARRLFDAAGEPKELWIVFEAKHRAVDRVLPGAYDERVLGFFDRWMRDA